MIEWTFACGYLQRDEYKAAWAIRELAVCSKTLPLMRRIADQHKPRDSEEWCESWDEAMDEACKRGKVKVFRWLAEHPIGVDICEGMKQSGNFSHLALFVLEQNPADVDFLQYLYEQDLFVDDSSYPVLPEAIKRGQPLEVLKWLVDHIDPKQLPQDCVMDNAAAKGRLEILQYFQRLQLSAFTRNTLYSDDEEDPDQNPDAPLWCTTKAMDEAAANGHLKVVQWLHASRPEGCTVAAMDAAASNGLLGVVKWLHLNRSEGCTVAAMDGAAANGHLKTVKWLDANTNAQCTTDAMDNAAGGGHLETLKWLHENTSNRCTDQAINNALRSRHFRVASWLHEHFPEYVPTKLIGWSYLDNSFEELLFREEHYDGIFTPDYLQGLKDPSREDSYHEKGEAWSWVKAKYLGA